MCATDLAYIPYGIALGHEGVGIVEAIGSEVTQFKVGDRVCPERKALRGGLTMRPRREEGTTAIHVDTAATA